MGALAHERDGDGVGADTVAGRAGCGVGGIKTRRRGILLSCVNWTKVKKPSRNSPDPTMTPAGTAAVLAAVLAIALAGCVTTTVVMKNPQTGQVQVCQRPSFGSHDAATACAEALKRDGWIELGRD